MNDSPDPPEASRQNVFEIGADRHLHPIFDEEPSGDWLRDETVRWIAIRNYGVDEVEVLCESCGVDLPPQASEVIRNPSAQPQVLRLESLLVISYSLGVNDTTRRVLVLCAPSTILTFHESGELMDDVSRDCQQERRLRCHAPIAVLFELIDAALERVASRVFALRRELVTLTDALGAGTRELDSEARLGLKQEATDLEIQLEDLLHCLASLAKYDSESVDSNMVRPLLLQLQGNLDRGLEAVGRLKGRIGDLHQFQVGQADATTNRRLKVLTILSAVYLPATLIAGIYGMNFEDIPITSTPHGYGFVILIMTVIVVAQLAYFYKRGWFK